MSLTGVLIVALKVLTTNEQPPQSRVLVEVMVERKTVLVASKGSSKTGCRVVHVDCADAWNAAKRDRQKTVKKAIANRWSLGRGQALVVKDWGLGNLPFLYTFSLRRRMGRPQHA